jgi:hypothetical protein
MAVFYFQNEAYSFPDSYREWDITIERDVARMSFRITSRATDTTGQRHGCESLVDEHYFRYSASEAQEYFRHVIRSHLRRIDDYSQDLSLQGITLRPRYANGGVVRALPTFVGLDFASLERGLEQVGQSAQQLARTFETMFPSEFPPKQETPIQPEQDRPKRKRLEPKPPSEAPAQLSVKPKPRKLRL